MQIETCKRVSIKYLILLDLCVRSKLIKTINLLLIHQLSWETGRSRQIVKSRESLKFASEFFYRHKKQFSIFTPNVYDVLHGQS